MTAIIGIVHCKIIREILYRTIQNFGGRKFWRNGSQQRLADKILANEQNTIRHKLLEGENFGKMAQGKDWRIKYT